MRRVALPEPDAVREDQAESTCAGARREGVRYMEFAFDLTYLGWALVVIASLAFGLIAQFVGDAHTRLEWLADAIAFAVGAIVASEFIVAWQTFEPVWEGVALVPALIGGLVLGVIVEFVTRRATGGTYTGAPMSA
jgi:uncharacterized membrane protein YeaQ/YmgE (transglycosylase-associated protein family)